MIDKRKQFIISYLNSFTDNGYVVVSLSEICTEILKNTNENTDKIAEDLRELAHHGYIKLKYDDGENFCVTSTEKGRSFIDVDEENEKTFIKLYSGYKSVVGWVIFSAFIGAFTGSVITTFILKIFGG